MKKTNKFLYLYVVQGYYNSVYGWEDLVQSEDYKEARGNLKDYRENETRIQHRLIKRRVKNPDYKDITE